MGRKSLSFLLLLRKSDSRFLSILNAYIGCRDAKKESSFVTKKIHLQLFI